MSNNLKGRRSRLHALARQAKSINYGTAGVGGINHLGTELPRPPPPARAHPIPGHRPGVHRSLSPAICRCCCPPRLGDNSAFRPAMPARRHRRAAPPLRPTCRRPPKPGCRASARGMVGLLARRSCRRCGQRLNQELNTALSARCGGAAREGATLQPSTPEAFGKLIRSESCAGAS